MGECNTCHLARLQKRYGDRLIKIVQGRWTSYYIKGKEPSKGQGQPTHLDDGTPIAFAASYLGVGQHTFDEDCSAPYPKGGKS